MWDEAVALVDNDGGGGHGQECHEAETRTNDRHTGSAVHIAVARVSPTYAVRSLRDEGHLPWERRCTSRRSSSHAGQQVPKRVVTEETTFDQAGAQAVLSQRQY